MDETISIRLVIPDAAVLIALARADLLDLLVSFKAGAQLVITDVVAYEATRNLDTPDSIRIQRFLDAQSNRIRIDPTAFAGLIARSKVDASIELPKSACEMSIYGYINASLHFDPGVPTLVLCEDGWFIRNEARQRNVYLAPLGAFLKAIESMSSS